MFINRRDFPNFIFNPIFNFNIQIQKSSENFFYLLTDKYFLTKYLICLFQTDELFLFEILLDKGNSFNLRKSIFKTQRKLMGLLLFCTFMRKILSILFRLLGLNIYSLRIAFRI